ncbi:MAG: hypothetical protein HY718_20175 [Planctomycetes bacterium]|nr:hypothetical protein [Planctomycetota bacterium]
MSTTVRRLRFAAVIALHLLASTSREARAAQVVLTVPIVSGRPERQPFTGHPGWIDGYAPGSERSVSARLKPDATFDLPDPQQPMALIVCLDRL